MIDRLSPDRWIGLAGLLALAAITGALGFEHIGGILPCPLCLEQRWAYYLGVPAALAAAALWRSGMRGMASVLFAAIALGFLWNAGFGVYHSGIEWKWWPGPSECSGASTVAPDAGSLLESLNDTRVVRCDEAAWRLFGLSLAGYSALISLAVSGMALLAFLGSRRADR